MLVAIDTLANKVSATVPIGQAPQALAYVSNAVPDGDGMLGLQPLGIAGQAAHLTMAPADRSTVAATAPTSVALFDQGLTQVLEASVTGLGLTHPHVLALADHADGSGKLEPLASFMTNPAGSAIVNAVGPIRQIVQNDVATQRRYLVIFPGAPGNLGKPAQLQVR